MHACRSTLEDPTTGDRALHATALIARGAVFHAAGDSARALDAYGQASAELPPDDLAGRARVLLYRAELLDGQRQYALARPLLEEARALAIELTDFSVLLGAEANLADNAMNQRDFDRAERHLDNAEIAGLARGERTPLRGVLINRAILARYRGEFSAAKQALDAVAASSPPPDTAWLVAHERGQLAAAQHDDNAAAESYLAAIEIVEQMWRASSPDELRAPLFEDRWLPYRSLFSRRVEQGAAAAAFASVTSAQGRMFLHEVVTTAASTGDSAGRRDRLRTLAPLMAASPLARALGPTEALAMLGDRYVLNYFAGGGRMRLLIIDRGEARLTSVDVEISKLEELVDAFLAHPDDRSTAAALGDVLLPSDAFGAAPVRFHVIPDGPLLHVPFAGLIAGGSRVVEHHEVVYAPSATGLAGLAMSASPPTRGAVVLGDARNDLLHANEDIAGVVAATGATARIGAQATIAALRDARHAGLLHVAVHSGFNVNGGYLALADGEISASDIISGGIGPRLVVLPTCASAATPRRDMWGSLAVAFLAAGSNDVVATLFSVEDAMAAEFAVRFYRHRGDRDPVSATAIAQREMAAKYPVSVWWAFLVVGL